MNAVACLKNFDCSVFMELSQILANCVSCFFTREALVDMWPFGPHRQPKETTGQRTNEGASRRVEMRSAEISQNFKKASG